MPEHCPRCEAALPQIDGSSAAFCAVCGLPQLRVSEDALQQANATPSPAQGSSLQAGAVEWTLAFRVLFFAGLLGLLPSLLRPEVLVTGGGGIPTLLLLPLLVLGSGAAYLRRRPYPPFTPGMGTRMGTVLALGLWAALAVASGVVGFIMRYGMHSRVVQTNLDAALQLSQTWMSGGGGTVSPEWAAMVHWPEMRAGAFLFSHVMTGALLLLVGAAAGAIGGALLQGQQRRSQQ